MRVSPDRTPELLAALSKLQDDQQSALEQMASGKRVQRPSDDPLASAALIENHDNARRTDQYLQNVSNIRSMLQSVDSTVGSVVTSLNRAVTLGVEGSTGTLSADQRQQIAAEVKGVRDQILQLANTSFHGVYVFAGTATQTQPFQLGQDGSTVIYTGNNGLNSVAVGAQHSIGTNVPGSRMFQAPDADVFGALQQLVSALEGGTPDAMAAATDGVRSALNNVTEQRVSYGTALDQLDQSETSLQQQATAIKTEENQLIGADLATAATNLSKAQVAQSAVLASGAKIISQSLLDFLT